MALEFRILGPFEVVEKHRRIGLGGPRQRAVLAILLVHRGEPMSTDRLVHELWGEEAPASAVKTLQGYISHLRKAVGREVLVSRAGGYVLAVAAERVDAERFGALVSDARRARATGDVAGARRWLDEALALWRGEPLADFAFEPFARTEIVRLEEMRLGALEDRIDADLALGRHRAVASELEGLVARHPNRERLLGQLMLTLYLNGRHAEALEAFRRGRETLHEELGLDPGPELRDLEQRILDHDPSLTAAAAPLLTPRQRSRRRGALAAAAALALAAGVGALVAGLGRGTATTARAAPNSVVAIDTRTNGVVGQAAVGARPGAVTFAAHSLWVANRDDGTVSRVDPRSLRTLRTLTVGGPPSGLAATDNAVWVVRSGRVAGFVAASRIDPSFDTIGRTVRLANLVPRSRTSLAARGSSLWVAPYAGELARLDPSSGHVVQHLDPNAAPAGIAVDRHAVWLSDSEAGTVVNVDRGGVEGSLAVGEGPSAIAASDGDVWVTDTGEDTVVRISATRFAVTARIPVGRAPAGVTLGAGAVWVANRGDGTVTRIDPRLDKPVATIRVGGSPQAITVAEGRAWVTVDAPTVSGPAPANGGTARLATLYHPNSMDPALAEDDLSWQLLYATCAKLLNYPDRSGPAGSVLVPEVAQSLPARSPDGRTYTFTVRPGFQFSPPSNEPVTAKTFKDAIERTLNPRMRSPVAAQFRDITGAQAYMAGRAAHIAGVSATARLLTIRLTRPAPDFPARMAQPAFCAVPSDTPITPQGVGVIPSAGPYRVVSYIPDETVILERNPHYHGRRPHRLARIVVSLEVPSQRGVRAVETGSADVTAPVVPRADATRLAGSYGAGSAAARAGRQRYFAPPVPELDFLALNTHRPLFARAPLRRAVGFAIDRAALAALGDESSTLPEPTTDHYLPPGVPGYRDLHVYPVAPDLAAARRLARGHVGATATLYTCSVSPCGRQARIIERDLAAIGLRVRVKAFPDPTLYAKLARPGEPFDLAELSWISDYPDPRATLNALLSDGTVIPTLRDSHYRAKLVRAAQLTGPRRYLAYARLDADLARNAAPLVAYGNASDHEFFSARMACQTYNLYGLDLAALCTR